MAMINRTGLDGRNDFIGFTFDGRHSSEFNIIQVSSGNRMGKELLPSPKDITTQVTGVDGSYYFNSTYGNRTFSINFAFDDLRENDFRAMQYWLNKKEPAQLVFDEAPYKSWTVKISNAPNLKFICFDEKVGGKVIRIYKGEGTVSFVSYSIIAKAPFPFLEAYNWDYLNNKVGYDLSGYYTAEYNWRANKGLLVDDKDKNEKQVDRSLLVLDQRLGIDVSNTIIRPKKWYNFDQWKETSRLKTQAGLDISSTTWESVVNGFDFGTETSFTGTPANLETHKASHGKLFKQIGEQDPFPPQQPCIRVNNSLCRRYGYLSEIIFTGLSTYGTGINGQGERILLDAPTAIKHFANKDASGHITSYKWEKMYNAGNIKNVDYRRKLTNNLDPVYTRQDIKHKYVKYNDVSKNVGGLGNSITIKDPWGPKIGPVRGITGKWCHIYNPGNYKTYPKIILSVMDKRSMITRSQCNYPTSSVTALSNGQYTVKKNSNGNYSDWRYATLTLYPNYKGVGVGEYTENDVLGRISLDLTKLVPKVAPRDNPEKYGIKVENTITLQGDDVTPSATPKVYNYVIDCELRLIYRVSSVDTNPDQGWGPARAERDGGPIPSPYQYYNTTFVPTNDIRNNAIIAGDFFEIPPYELDRFNEKEIIPGRYLIAFNPPAAACVGPFVWPTYHFADLTEESDYSYIGQRVVWDINYL